MGTTPNMSAGSEAQDLRAIADLVHGLNALAWEVDAQTFQVLFISQGAERLLGYPVERWLTEPDFWAKHVHPGDQKHALALCREAATQGRDYELEYRLIAADGRPVWLRNIVRVVCDSEGRPQKLRGVTVEITEQKRAEDALRESEEKFSKAFRSSPDAIIITTLAEGRFLEVNENFQKLFGYSRDEILGRTSVELDLWINPRERAQLVALVRRDGEIRDMEVRFRTKSGQHLSAIESAHLIELSGSQCILSMIRDITERKALEEQVRQSQKMEAVGRLAGGVAHDFNNLLVAILGYSELVRKKIPPDDPLGYMVSNIHSAACRGRDLTAHLLALSRKQLLQPIVLDLNELVLQTEGLLRRVIRGNIELVTDLAPDALPVKADPIQLEQVLLNLALNGNDTMPNGGTLTIRTAQIEVNRSLGQPQPGTPPVLYAQLTVMDTGRGMSPEALAKIFDPYFTTNETGKLSGLSLSAVYGIVKQSGGWITTSSLIGLGTTFNVLLPRAEVAPELAGRPAEVSQTVAGTETILLIEENDLVQRLAREVLSEAGYTVLHAQSGDDALRLARAHEGAIHLLLADLLMEEISEAEFVRQLLKERPDTRVLYISDGTGDTLADRAGLPENSPILQKPFTPDQLLGAVHDALSGKSSGAHN